MNRDDLPAWITQAKTLLDEEARDLDAATLSRLNRARQAALATRTRPSSLRWLFPAGLASACMLLLAVAVLYPHRPAPTMSPFANAAGASGDVEIVSGEDTLEFYQDLEFYAWLDAQDQDSEG